MALLVGRTTPAREVLQADHDEAGLAAIATAAPRLRNRGLRVQQMLPPPGADWCDVLETYEARAGVLEYDGGMDRHEAEELALKEVLNAT